MTADELKPILDKHVLWLTPAAEGGARADLYGANLRSANLRSANLRSANLRSANLYGANLYGANLRSANLEGANLEGADLEGANLQGADLEGADLYGASLYGANLRSANLEGADLEGADLRSANLRSANLEGARGLAAADPMPDIRARVLAAVERDGCAIDMESWHSCDTTHCLGGWITTLHPQGKLLESIYETGTAAAIILHASGEKIPDFYDVSKGADERAMNWLRTGQQVDTPSEVVAS